MVAKTRVVMPASAAAAAIFKCLVGLRNHLYDAQLLAQRRLPNAVISIGNLTVGGSGKTPLAIHLAQIICDLGRTPVLLSRGYRRKTAHDVILAPGEEPASLPETVGDEPALVRRREPQVWLAISADRHRAGMEVARRCRKPVFILDDGFQHRRLRRDLDILVIDPTQPLASNHLLPRGTLREPLKNMRRADIIVLNGTSEQTGARTLADCIRPHLKSGAMLLGCSQGIEALMPLESWQKGSPPDAGCGHPGPCYLVAAIGNPERFRRDASALGLDVKGARFFRDHTRLTHAEWLACADEARKAGAQCIITTEKDAIKLAGTIAFPLLVAVQDTRMDPPAGLRERLALLIGSGSEAD